jgi:hypothetical protein
VSMKPRFNVPIEPRKDDGAVPATQPPPVILQPDGLTTSQRIDAMHARIFGTPVEGKHVA